METYNITTPLTRELAERLRAGDRVYVSGVIYTARDAAHKRLAELLDSGGELPFPLEDSVVYYVGPTPPSPGQVIGSAGPTTSYRMDSYTPRLLDLGMRGMIGKGKRSEEVVAAMKRGGAVYFAAIGGLGAFLSGCVKAAEVIAFPDLGAEAVRRLTVADFPVMTVIDSRGANLYQSGREAYLTASGGGTKAS
ncbi:MAG: Fe-S-containing hydro-lyase [Spirochaetaceae bacterium]|jgi:fumarate hydratase subunit beta|nr:Fe-S-containing hydro-lyase [Spirochaetaceae bacterium]